jgi:2-polyprenyl-3-methyl-5-hydroxy-6-metoxy-1,4-benzoquinol methylase
VDKAYAQQYRQLHLKHWWWRARQHAVLATVSDLCADRTAADILDVGCGDGLLFESLERWGNVQGVEVDPATIDPESPWRDRITLAAFDSNFQPEKLFDLILMLDVLEHLPDPRAALHRAMQLLKPGGQLLITVPAFPLLWTSHDYLNRHYTRYTRRSLAGIAAGIGTVQFTRYFFHWLFPVKLAVRAKELAMRSEPRAPAIPCKTLNDFFYGLSRLEQRFAKRWPLPFGSSLMAVLSR